MAAILTDAPQPLPLTDREIDVLHWVAERAFRRVVAMHPRYGAREARIAACPRALAVVAVPANATRADIAEALADASNHWLGELIRRRWTATQRRVREGVA